MELYTSDCHKSVDSGLSQLCTHMSSDILRWHSFNQALLIVIYKLRVDVKQSEAKK